MKCVTNFFTSCFLICFLIFSGCGNNHPSGEEKAKKNSDSTGVKPEKKQVVFSNKVDRDLNEIALFTAGLKIDSASKFYRQTQNAEWRSYFNESSVIWGKFESYKNKIHTWASNEKISQLCDKNKTVFYPFSGPDFLFADLFFPSANKYILIGLEKTGSVPKIDTIQPKNLKPFLTAYKISINDVIYLSFFKTNDMKKDLASEVIDGATPVIMMFLARSGKEIIRISPMIINENGELIPSDKSNKKSNIVEFVFKDPADNQVKTIDYISADLSDHAVKKNISLNNYLTKLDNHLVTFVKSATYLMHKHYFSIIRNMVLEKSMAIFQDDSGIPYASFDKNQWDIQLYGNYTKPINLFKDYYQPNLLEDYQNNSKPLNFRIGYNSVSNMMLARKK